MGFCNEKLKEGTEYKSKAAVKKQPPLTDSVLSTIDIFVEIAHNCLNRTFCSWKRNVFYEKERKSRLPTENPAIL